MDVIVPSNFEDEGEKLGCERNLKNSNPICTFSLDSNSVLFSTCYAGNNSEEMINWHLKQSRDEALNKIIDYYHYFFDPESGKVLNIGIPKTIRQCLNKNMIALLNNTLLAFT